MATVLVTTRPRRREEGSQNKGYYDIGKGKKDDMGGCRGGGNAGGEIKEGKGIRGLKVVKEKVGAEPLRRGYKEKRFLKEVAFWH
jgi:hypothetical protein